MSTNHGRLGLGLGLPTTSSPRNHLGHSRGPRERSYSLHGPTRPHESHHAAGSYVDYSLHPSSISADQAHPSESFRIMGVAAEVIGGAHIQGLTPAPKPKRNSSNETAQTLPDKDLGDMSVAHLKLARHRVRSEPATRCPTDMTPTEPISPKLPRADSLLQLDSDATSIDLKKLMSTRVRQAPPSIDTRKANASGFSSVFVSPIKEGSHSSRLEAEKSRPRVEVYFELNNNVVVEGGYIRGILTVRIRKARRGEVRYIRIDGGKIRVLGYESVLESERYAFYQCTSPLAEVSSVTDCSRLFQSQPDADGFGVAQEGTFTLPFKMHLTRSTNSHHGKNLPKGVIQDNSVTAAIKYILLVSFKVRDEADNASGLDAHAGLINPKTLIAHFYRHVEVWPMFRPTSFQDPEEVRAGVNHSGTVSSRNAQGVLFGGSGLLHLTAVLHQKVWLAGQKCAVYVGARNDTRKFVKTFSLSIIRTSTVARPNQSGSTSRKQIAEVVLDAVRGPTFDSVVGKGWWAGIEPGAHSEFSHLIDIPGDALTVPRTHIIGISYALRVTLNTGSLSSSVSVDLPFTIVNALSTEGLPVPPPPGLLIESLKLPKHVPVSFDFKAQEGQENLGLRGWDFPETSSQESSTLPRDCILDWTKRTLTHASGGTGTNSTELGFTKEIDNPARNGYQTPPQPGDGSTICESVSNFIAQLESDLESAGSITNSDREPQSMRPATDRSSSEQSSGSAISSRLPSSARHRVCFLIPVQHQAQEVDRAPESPTENDPRFDSDTVVTSMLPRTSFKTYRFVLPDDDLKEGKPDVLPDPRGEDAWRGGNADARLKPAHMDNEGPSAYRTSGFSGEQEVIINGSFSGPHTSSTSSSEPWSANGTASTGYHSSDNYRNSIFEVIDQESDLPISLAQRSIIFSAPGSQYDCTPHSAPFLEEATPRAGTIRKFQPEFMSGSVQPLASRATLVPTISSPMLAKSQSARVVGSPVNHYRRFMLQQVATVLPSDEPAKVHSHLSSKGKRTLNAGRTPWKETWDQKDTSIPHDLTQIGVTPSVLKVKRTGATTDRIHLRSHSTPQPYEELNPTKVSHSTVRSRVAALEERSRSRPFSSYS